MCERFQIRLGVRRSMAVVAGVALVAWSPALQADWAKHFRVGMSIGLNVDAEFKTGGNFGLSGNTGTIGADHFYDDGYVRQDDTGNAGGLTTFWGYTDGSQVTGTDIAFHRTQSFNLSGASSAEADDAPYLGFETAYGGPITRLGPTRIGWQVGYGLLPIEISDRRTLTGDAVRDRFLHAHGGIVIPPPPYNGGPSGEQQPAIGATPTPGGQTMTGVEITGPRTLDVTLHNLRLGPTVHWEFARRWALEGSAGGALGIVTGDYRFNETLNFASGGSTQNRGSFGETDFVYGGYVNGIVLFHVEEHGDIYAGVQFMSLSDSEFDKGGRSAKLNLGGAISFLVGINWPF